MPNLGAFHPQVVHFVIALLVVGVGLRLVSLLNRWPWMNPAAAALIVLGAVASAASVKTGTDAHGPVERVPGTREAVSEHEEWGERTRNIFLAIAALELMALALAENRRKLLRYATAALGAGGLFAVYETGEHGGELVYSYAGGVGIRSGDKADVSRLLLAGLYHQAMLDRRENRPAEAAALFAQMAARYPADASIQLLAVESQLRDAHDPASARQAIDAVQAGDDPRLRRAVSSLKADIYAQAGHKDSARTLLESLLRQAPTNLRLRARLDSLR